MNKTISKLPNGDFRVEPDNTTVYGIRNKYINNEERTMREKLRPKFVTETEQWKTNQDIAIIDDIILSAHHRIAMYETLNQGLWHSIFGTDNTDEILKERELIREFKKMKQEMIQWTEKKKTQF